MVNSWTCRERPLAPDLGDPSDYGTARLRMMRIWKDGVVKWSRHAQQHMQDEGIDDMDVHHVIKFGKIANHETSEYEGHRYRYVLRGRSIDGFGMRVVVDLDGQMTIVTCFID